MDAMFLTRANFPCFTPLLHARRRCAVAARSVASEMRAAGRALHEGVVRSTEDCLCLPERIDLARAGLFPHVIELQQPVTLGVQGRNVFEGSCEFLRCRSLFGCLLLKRSLQVCLDSFLFSDRLRI